MSWAKLPLHEKLIYGATGAVCAALLASSAALAWCALDLARCDPARALCGPIQPTSFYPYHRMCACPSH